MCEEKLNNVAIFSGLLFSRLPKTVNRVVECAISFNEIPNIPASNSADPDTHRLSGSDGASQSFVNINGREHNGSRNLRAVNTIRQNEASSSTDSSDDSDLWEPVFPPPKRRRTSAFILSSNYTEIEPPIHDSP